MRRRTYPLNVNNGFEDWGGYMNAKKQKLEEQFCIDAEKGTENHKTDIFKGISIFVNGYTVPSAEELKLLMMKHGGIYHHYQSARTTHIIASNLPDTKIKQLKGTLKIVKPEWIVDSIKANKLLNYDNYLLYSNQSTTQPTLKFSTFSTKISQTKIFENTEDVKFKAVNGHASPCDLFEETSALADAENVSCNNSKVTTSEKPKSEVSPIKQSTSKWTAKNATDDNFLTEFYNNSRLHHIATMGAMFKDYVNELRDKNDKSFPGRKLLKEVETSSEHEDDHELSDAQNSKHCVKTIMHIDMDCFFVSVGLRSHPELRGMPVAVTHSKKNPSRLEANENVKKEIDLYKKRTVEKYKKTGVGNDHLIEKRISWANNLSEADSLSEIASCSYEARKFGLKNGMFLGQALKLCPDLKMIPYDFEGYKEVSSTLYNCVASFTLDIEAVSCDEMFVDCSSLLKETGVTALQFATVLRGQIKEKTNCPCSTGFGSNRLLARLATRKAKPDGQFHLSDEIAPNIMKSINVSDLPGVGRATVYKLSTLGVKTCADLEKISVDKLKSEFGGKTGLSLYKNCRGQDDQALNFSHQRKSISAEVNYGIRFTNQAERDTFLQKLSKEVENRLREVKMKGRCITLKFMVRAKDAPLETAKFMGHGVCDHMTKSISLRLPTANADVIYKEVMNVVQQWAVAPQDLRGIGIQMSRLEKEINVAKSSLHCFLRRTNSSQKISKTAKAQLPTIDTSASEAPTLDTLVSKSSTLDTSVSISDTLGAPSTLNEKKVVHNNSNDPHSGPSQKNGYQKIEIDFSNPQPGPSHENGYQRISSHSLETLFNHKSGRNHHKVTPVDNTVLEALPEEIRREVLIQYQDQLEFFQKLEKSNHSPKKNGIKSKGERGQSYHEFEVTLSQVDTSFLEALPSDLRQELIQDLSHKASKKQKKDNHGVAVGNIDDKITGQVETTASTCKVPNDDVEELDFSLPIPVIRKLIKQWTMVEEEPTECDISIFSRYLIHLACNKKLEHLSEILSMLHRLIDRKGEYSWRKAYTVITEAVQQAMIQTYNSKLFVNEFFPP